MSVVRVRRVRPGPEHASKECAWCKGMLASAEQVAICAACGSEQHGVCWDERGGCARVGACRFAPAEAPRRASALSLGVSVAEVKKRKREAQRRAQRGTVHDGGAAARTTGAQADAFRAALTGLASIATLVAHPMLRDAPPDRARWIRMGVAAIVALTAPMAFLRGWRSRDGGWMAWLAMLLALGGLAWGFTAIRPLL